MAMASNGLAKLVEECGELQVVLLELLSSLGKLQQIAGKKLAYPDTDEHPDGAGSMKRRLEDEMADVKAAIHFVALHLGLSEGYISGRALKKYTRFEEWHNENNEEG
jgi:hypothetical protein